MKKILLFLLIGSFGLIVKAQDQKEIQKDYAGAIIEFEQETINYGDIAKNSDGNRTFKFKNTGKSPLIILNLRGSCGCTVPTKPEEPIMPGETGEIGVKYATNRVGPFSKTITVTSNALEQKQVLIVKGRVLDQEVANNELENKKSIVSEK